MRFGFSYMQALFSGLPRHCIYTGAYQLPGCDVVQMPSSHRTPKVRSSCRENPCGARCSRQIPYQRAYRETTVRCFLRVCQSGHVALCYQACAGASSSLLFFRIRRSLLHRSATCRGWYPEKGKSHRRLLWLNQALRAGSYGRCLQITWFGIVPHSHDRRFDICSDRARRRTEPGKPGSSFLFWPSLCLLG